MFQRDAASHLCATLLALAATTAFAQSPAQLAISAAKTEFRLGELISLELKFTSATPNRFLAGSRQYDRVGRLNGVERFEVEPADGVDDPLAGLPGGQGGMGGITGGPTVLSEKPYVLERVLNEYVRFRRPGEYRIRVVSQRVTEVEDPRQLEGARLMAVRGKPVEVTSNVLTLSILPASDAWIAQEIATARAALAQPYPPANEEIGKARRHAIDVLRALGTADAAMELLRAPADDTAFPAHITILSSPDRKQLLPRLEQFLVAPGQGIPDRLLDTLAELAEIVASGSTPEYPKDPEQQKQWQAESKRRADLRQRKQEEYIARLIESLPSKQPEARAVSLHGLLEIAMRGPQARPWLGSVAAGLAGEFRHLPAPMQMQLLESYWGAIRTPALLPVLRELLESPQLCDMALRRIYELAPDEGRRIILDEIRRPQRHFAFSVLAMLPDAALPDLDEVLAERRDALLILRYASGGIVKRVEEAYFAQSVEHRPCAGPLALYFLKYDPPVGEKLLGADFAKSGSPGACYDLGFQFLSLGRWAYSPALERLAIASLTSDKVPLKRGAAELLRKYGSAAAKKPLWEAMEYFRGWWKDRESDLNEKIGEESRQLELALRLALGRADAWVLTDAELRRLLDLCSSEWCRNDVKGWSVPRESPVYIFAHESSGVQRFTVDDYGPGDAEWLTRKVAQFPGGLSFRIQAPPFAGDVRERAEKAVRAAGRVVVQ